MDLLRTFHAGLKARLVMGLPHLQGITVAVYCMWKRLGWTKATPGPCIRLCQLNRRDWEMGLLRGLSWGAKPSLQGLHHANTMHGCKVYNIVLSVHLNLWSKRRDEKHILLIGECLERIAYCEHLLCFSTSSTFIELILNITVNTALIVECQCSALLVSQWTFLYCFWLLCLPQGYQSMFHP
jgi:hypothetical protein